VSIILQCAAIKFYRAQQMTMIGINFLAILLKKLTLEYTHCYHCNNLMSGKIVLRTCDFFIYPYYQYVQTLFIFSFSSKARFVMGHTTLTKHLDMTN